MEPEIRIAALESFKCVDWEASNDVCEGISSESSCIPRVVEAGAVSTIRVECGTREKASAFTVVGLCTDHRMLHRMLHCDIYWRIGGIVRLYSFFGVSESRAESEPSTWVRQHLCSPLQSRY